MTRTNSLPLYVKRYSAIIIISLITIFVFGNFNSIPTPEDPPNTIDVVVIDAGHGGKDPGAVGRISKEKDLALAIALKVGEYIENNIEDVKVIYTRKTDVFLELFERTELANKAEADLFISIHVNANNKSTPYGASCHILGVNQTGVNLDVAIRENSVILLEDNHETNYMGFDPTSPESYVIFSLMQNTFAKQSIEFASYVQDQFRDRAKRKDRGVIQQPLWVLSRSAMPGVLIETGFISNPDEERFLNSENGQDLIASAIYRAFRDYKHRIENRSNFTLAEETLARDLPLEIIEEEVLPEPADPDKITFRVQIASSKNLVDTNPADFNGLPGVSVIQQGKWYKYTIGEGLDYHEALDKCSEVKGVYPGAFVIAIKEEQLIPLSDALKEINQ